METIFKKEAGDRVIAKIDEDGDLVIRQKDSEGSIVSVFLSAEDAIELAKAILKAYEG